MTTKTLIIVCAVLVFWMSGCGSQPAANETAVKNNPGGAPAVNAASGQPEGIAVNSANSNIDPDATPAGEIAMSNRRGIVPGPAGPPMKAPTKYAPESSTISMTMGKNGEFIETRV